MWKELSWIFSLSGKHHIIFYQIKMNFLSISGLTDTFHNDLISKMYVLHMFKSLLPFYQTLCKFWGFMFVSFKSY